jgi:hypothetical protein
MAAVADGLASLDLDVSQIQYPSWWDRREEWWELRQLRDDTRWRLKRTSQDIIAVGNNLRRMQVLRQELKPGTWMAWSTHVTGLSYRHVQNLMWISEQAETVENFSTQAGSLFKHLARKPKDEPDDDEEMPVPPYASEQIEASAFAYYRRTYPGSYPYKHLPVHVSLQKIDKLARIAVGDETLRTTTLGISVADTYHPHRMHATAAGMRSPFETFSHDATLKAALRKELKLGGFIGGEGFSMLSLSQGTQACANFRPGFALSLYRRYCTPGAVVLDTSTGYGGRLVGFIASGLAGTYIGIDPNTQTHEGNLRLARELDFAEHVELINLPAEDVDPGRLAGRCDFAFTSPPYFAKEHYSDEDTQSWVRYPTPESWREGFLAPMLRLTYEALKPGAFAVLNVAPVTIRNVRYPVHLWVQEAAQSVGFIWERQRTEKYPLPHRLGRHSDEAAQPQSEPVLVFGKPAQRDDQT